MVGVGCTDTCVCALVWAAAWLMAACAVMQVAVQVTRLWQADGHFKHEAWRLDEAKKVLAVGGDPGHPGTEGRAEAYPTARAIRKTRSPSRLHSCSALDYLEEDRANVLPIANATPTRLDGRNQSPDGSDMREHTRTQRRRRSPPPARESSGNRPSLTPSQARALRQQRKGCMYIPK